MLYTFQSVLNFIATFVQFIVNAGHYAYVDVMAFRVGMPFARFCSFAGRFLGRAFFGRFLGRRFLGCFLGRARDTVSAALFFVFDRKGLL